MELCVAGAGFGGCREQGLGSDNELSTPPETFVNLRGGLIIPVTLPTQLNNDATVGTLLEGRCGLGSRCCSPPLPWFS